MFILTNAVIIYGGWLLKPLNTHTDLYPVTPRVPAVVQ